MFSEQDLTELVEFRSEDVPVLSLYLNVDPTQQTTDQYRLVLRSLLKEAASEAKPADVEAVAIVLVQHHLGDVDPVSLVGLVLGRYPLREGSEGIATGRELGRVRYDR